MSDTHINAFYMAVDEAEAGVRLAKAKLEEAKVALETKKQEDGVVDEPTEVESQPEVKSKPETKTKK